MFPLWDCFGNWYTASCEGQSVCGSVIGFQPCSQRQFFCETARRVLSLNLERAKLLKKLLKNSIEITYISTYYVGSTL